MTFDGGKEEVKWACQAGSSTVSEFRLDMPTSLARLELKGMRCISLPALILL